MPAQQLVPVHQQAFQGAPPPPPGQPPPEMLAAAQAQAVQAQAMTAPLGVAPCAPQLPHQAMFAQAAVPLAMGSVQGLDALAQFCMQNGIDAAVQQVLRSAPAELQIRVMNEGPLVGGNPSEVLLQRVRRMMGQG
mmetsp:Transcript_29856/g.69419  ORF Transcript_29856/g.69419 Transcript_29856/m.69419 type:complete len:135 (+) Transcript_29856:692-1096(+)